MSDMIMYSAEYKNSWKELFSRVPCGDDSDRPAEHVNVLAALIRDYGRDVQGHPDFKPTPANLDDYGMIDPVQFAGGPIEHAPFMTYRRTIADGQKGCVRKRRQKSSAFSDSSSDDNRHEKPVHIDTISRRSKKLSKAYSGVEEPPVDVYHDVSEQINMGKNPDFGRISDQ
jgi:hypothetical protein